ncbi:hypothetical protein ABEG10_08500 [Burkholderia cenocepacia]|uniref:hypothetical protein n=1 Tax=Burkholderia TaxID=32008 RepID=UPI0020A1825A|nr:MULTISPECIES: hypothetical protein [Burkholderia]MCL4631562.1 hypothetical protein [Burkholderia sp.]MCW5123780.1 hypothetical protein [Burkholderia cenocepacia]MCW5178975.1 hypothetical protein [Burkholderia cenocepacia]
MSEVKRTPAPKMVERKCKRCKTPFFARAADVKRGWGLFCSKSCKAIKQEQRTGQCRAYWDRQEARERGDEPTEFADAHLFSNEDYFHGKD